MYRILVVEDDRELNEALCYALKRQAYETVAAFSIQEAREKYQEYLGKDTIQLVIMDVNLPDGEGFVFCQWIKNQQEIPVLFLTARDLEEDVLKGYDLGAEDYVTKPFSMKILLRKIELILKRTQPEQTKGYDDGNLKIDWERAKIAVNQKECAVTPTEFRLLKILAENQGRLLTYDILLEQLWDCDGQFVDKHTLAVNINRLRRKLEDADHKYISNVYGMGYQWIG
ncbi:response regulator transcription factor [Mediterraneibacter agrestimuris]|uniref:response regulator transcription factor n=1 Tax=Mediterraneibacter agrestimuris TaxID=2941333 RepID=UPI00203E8BC5|nr:response regulator transcription factor [Mediterraneibacter agrestimuris]